MKTTKKNLRDKWRPFEEARTFVHSLGLKGKDKWLTWAKTTRRPNDIPANPPSVYKSSGWISWGDWLGTGTVANQNKTYMDFKDARAFVHNLELKTEKEWSQWAKSNAHFANIPAYPRGVYRDDGWTSLGDWLGTNVIAPQNRVYRPFADARTFVHSLALKGAEEWRRWAKTEARPVDIPANPYSVYKGKGWISLGDWLGTGVVANQNRTYQPFEQARAFARGLGLNGKDDWAKWCKTDGRPKNIPVNPPTVYRNLGWLSWGEWLGTGSVWVGNRRFRPFEEARAFAHSLRLKNWSEWQRWSKSGKRPADIPGSPAQAYHGIGWISLGDWLGTDAIATFNRTYLSFEEACAFSRNLGLKSISEWRAWAKTVAKPFDIPANPVGVYSGKGWVGWGDWLGTNVVANFNRIFLPFEEARVFVHNLGLKNQSEWRAWSKTADRPNDIPANPYGVYQDKGWTSWGDWLGAASGKGGKRKGKYRPFTQARAFVCTLELKNQKEWRKWAKSDIRPADIPAWPPDVYKDNGWTGWGDWLGTRVIATHNRVYRIYEKARAFVRGLKLKGQAEWRLWAKTSARPNDIPTSPDSVYQDKGWANWGDWLGTRNRKGGHLTFAEARTFVHNLRLKSKDEWAEWSQTDLRPADIPATPSSVYRGKDWTGWGDWLGTGTIASFNKIYLPFEEARAFVRDLKLKTTDEWRDWTKTPAKPDGIPANPYSVYQDTGWSGWGDWLGIFNLWNMNAALSFLYSVKPVLRDLQPAELYAIMRQNGMIASLQRVAKSSILIKSIRDLCASPTPEADFEELTAKIEKQNAALENEESSSEEESTPEIIPSSEETKEELPALRSLAALKAVDMLVEAGITSDEETIEFLIANRVSGLWQAALNHELAFDLDALRAERGGICFDTIRSRFLTQHDGASNLAIPAGYDFRVDGQLADPNLMQRLTAYRVLTERRLGNWSGVGAGKTLSAILASRVIDARLSIIVAFNSTVVPWSKRIIETYPDSDVLIKERGNLRIDAARHTYLILNFETFQQPDSVAMVQRLVDKHKIDFVVLDEIQSVKQRTPKITSKRRQVVNGLLSAASEKNPNLCVLGMSATPVINNLYEAKALLELVKGVEFSDLNTYSSIANASAMHEKLILYGIRYRPLYSQTIETEFKEIRANEYLARLKKVRKGAILDLESILLEAKTDTLIASLKKGTLVYTHYLTGLITPLRRAIEKAGFKAGLFTGKDKSGLELFKNGKVDVLIGSIPVGTGVDGLQYICNRMIVVSLPWTSAEYEQLVGRLYRQGSVFDKVEVIIPQVSLEYGGDVWSWDKMRMHRIQYKKTLADAALDGVIPQGELASPDTMFKQAREALQAWIARIEQDGVAFIERAKLRVPLPKEEAQIIQRRFGDLSVMNSRFNTAYSHTTHERLAHNPEEWYLYHTLYREARKTWPEIPYEKITKSLKRRPDWIVGDFGCGEAKLAEALPNKVYSFDHVAINENVTACDIAHTPIDDASLDVAVFSLSLMGLNYADYLKEAYRTLKFGGFLKIAEPVSRWSEKRSALLSTIAEAGFLLVGNVEESNPIFVHRCD